MLSRICTLSTVKRERRVELPSHQLSVADGSRSVEHLDDGVHHFTFPLAFRVWVPRREG